MKKKKHQGKPASGDAAPASRIDRNEWIVRAVAAAATRDKKAPGSGCKPPPEED